MVLKRLDRFPHILGGNSRRVSISMFNSEPARIAWCNLDCAPARTDSRIGFHVVPQVFFARYFTSALGRTKVSGRSFN